MQEMRTAAQLWGEVQRLRRFRNISIVRNSWENQIYANWRLIEPWKNQRHNSKCCKYLEQGVHVAGVSLVDEPAATASNLSKSTPKNTRIVHLPDQ